MLLAAPSQPDACRLHTRRFTNLNQDPDMKTVLTHFFKSSILQTHHGLFNDKVPFPLIIWVITWSKTVDYKTQEKGFKLNYRPPSIKSCSRCSSMSEGLHRLWCLVGRRPSKGVMTSTAHQEQSCTFWVLNHTALPGHTAAVGSKDFRVEMPQTWDLWFWL